MATSEDSEPRLLQAHRKTSTARRRTLKKVTSPRNQRLTQAERTARSDARIIKATVALIAKQGFSKTTLAQIGKLAGYTGGLVSHRFGSKQGLLQALVERITARFLQDQIMPAVAEQSGLDALCTMIDAYIGEITAREERIRALYVLMGEGLGAVPDVRSVFARLNREFRDGAADLIESGIAAGEIPSDIDPATEAAIVVAMLRGTALQWLTEPGCIDLDATRLELKELIRARLSA